MNKFLLFLLFFRTIISDDYSVEINSTIGASRFIMLSENTISNEATSIDTTGSDEFLLGSIEINLFNNSVSGTDRVYIENLEYDQTNAIFCAKSISSNGQLRIEVSINRNTNGNLYTSGSQDITPAPKALIRSTTTNIVNEKTILTFYAKDDPNNDPSLIGSYTSNFQFTWEDV